MNKDTTISLNAKKTFNVFSKIHGWREPDFDTVFVHADLYEVHPRSVPGALGNDKCLAIYKNGDFIIVDFIDDILKSERLCEYTMNEFTKLCEDAPTEYANVIGESEHYIVIENCEEAVLIDKSNYNIVSYIGKHPGGVKGIYIDPYEKYCITVGKGIFRYDIQETYAGYLYESDNPYVKTVGRESNIFWCSKINEVTDSYIEVSSIDNKIYRYNINTLQAID